MNIVLIKPTGEQFNITRAVSRVTWRGSASSAARELAFSYINAPFDSFGLPNISTGDIVAFSEAGDEVFYGQLFGSERSSAVGTITYNAYDYMKHLLESKGQYNFKNMTPEAIAMMVCSDAGIPLRVANGVPSIYVTGVNIASMICDNMTLYDIIMAAYTKAHRITGDKYFPMIYKRGLGIYKSNWIVSGFELADDENLMSSSIKESMDAIVNKVRVYDTAGNQIGEVTDNDSLELFGTFQQIYKQEDGVDPVVAATNLLHVLPSQKINVSCVGDINCISHYFVYVRDRSTGLVGRYWISSDEHTWENGAHTMELELTFDSIMSERDASGEE
ncbi:MAG: hypothetical protein KBS66_07410 [Eubacterium sp.]|nr:hypothetical protein [Candidatus Colimonas fimequi]